MSITNIKDVLLTLLGGITINDDGAINLPGEITKEWPPELTWKNKTIYWRITIGPNTDALSQPLDIGAYHKSTEDTAEVNVWVWDNKTKNYDADEKRDELNKEIREILLTNVNDPDPTIQHCNVSSWRDIDEPENDLVRTQIIIDFYYQTTRV